VRLFIAIEIPTHVRDALALFIKELRSATPHAKWVRAENLHVTLKFLGHTDAGILAKIERALQTVHSPQPVTLEFSGLGFFPNEKRPRVFWAGMKRSANLAPLAEAIDRTMHQLGFPLETRPFAPHLTLARFDSPSLSPKLAEAVNQNRSRNFGSLTTRAFHLIESKLKPTGAEYTELQSFPFAAEM
jgi:RNA 2',3'-cyclic 3'-phosphodiesterase